MKALVAWAVVVLALPLARGSDRRGEPDPSPGHPILNDATGRQRIESALPRHASVQPTQPRRLLIFDRNVGYGGHGSIPYANHAFKRMGEVTGAFTTTISRDPAVFQQESLKRFDAVFFNNTVGNLFSDSALRQSLIEFLYGGGGLLGVHGTSVAFTQWPGAIEDWPEFGILLGGRGANHRDSDERVIIKLDDPDHPLNGPFAGQSFEYRDEFFRVHDPYSRERVRVLLSIDTERTDMNQGVARGRCIRADNDYALAWVRGYGRGRVFYCTIAHNPYVFWDPSMLKFYLAAIQFALGDLPAPTTPSARLSPAVQAQEKLGWRLGMDGAGARRASLFAAIDKTAQLGLAYLGASSSQFVSEQIPKPFDYRLTEDEMRQIRLQLDEAGVRLLTYAIPGISEADAALDRLFGFARKMGVETITATVSAGAIAAVEQLCITHEINLALEGPGDPASASSWDPELVLAMCRERNARIGVCADLALWKKAGADPAAILGRLGHRLMALRIRDWPASDLSARENSGSFGPGQFAAFLAEANRLKLKPTLIGIMFSSDSCDAPPGTVRGIDTFNRISLRLAP